MKNLSSFFKILNKKINKYDKLATNPFTHPKRIVVIWVEDNDIQNFDTTKYENN